MKLQANRGAAPVLVIALVVVALFGGYLIGTQKAKKIEKTKTNQDGVPTSGLINNQNVTTPEDKSAILAPTIEKKPENFGLVRYYNETAGFGFYYPDTWKSGWNAAGDIVLSGLGQAPYRDDTITIKTSAGRVLSNSSGKFGSMTLWFDTTTSQWMKTWTSERDGGVIREAAPHGNTLSGLLTFAGKSSWATSIIPLSVDRFLVIEIGGSGNTIALSPFVKTVFGTGQSVDLQKVADALSSVR